MSPLPVPPSGRGVTSRVVALAAMIVLATTATTAATAALTPVSADATLRGVVPDIPTGGHLKRRPLARIANLPDGGGIVLHSNRTHLIFWAPAGSGLGFDAGYQQQLEMFLVRVAHDSRLPTNVYNGLVHLTNNAAAVLTLVAGLGLTVSLIGLLIASFTATSLNRESATLPIVWTKPISRRRIALEYFAVDLGTIAAVALPLIAYTALTVAGFQSPWVPKLDGGTLPASVTQRLGDAERRGAGLFVSKACFACHAIDGAGGRRGPDLSHVASHMNRDQITARIATGGGGMPAFAGSLTPSELDDLSAFLITRH